MHRQVQTGLILHPFTRYLREVLWVVQRINVEEDAHWLFRFKRHEVVGWSDQEEARVPDIVYARCEPGPVGKLFVSVSNGMAHITNMTFKDDA